MKTLNTISPSNTDLLLSVSNNKQALYKETGIDPKELSMMVLSGDTSVVETAMGKINGKKKESLFDDNEAERLSRQFGTSINFIAML